jgi:hypothetical protein
MNSSHLSFVLHAPSHLLWLWSPHSATYIMTLNLGVCILLRVLDEVQGFPSNATLFQ